LPKIVIRHYKLSDSQQHSLLDTDFSSPLSVQQKLWPRLSVDLSSFTNTQAETQLDSVLTVEIDGQNMEIHRGQGALTTVPELKPSLEEWLNDKFTVQPSSRILPADIIAGAADKDSLLKVVPNMLAAYQASKGSSGNVETSEVQKIK